MSFKMKYPILKQYLTNKTKRRPGAFISKVGFIVSHDTGNDGSTASGNVGWYEDTCNEDSASAQTFIDDINIIECIPVTTGPTEKAWHVRYLLKGDNDIYGDDANDIAIGVELCYSHTRGKINNKEAYKRYVWYHAYLCYKFKLDPNKDVIGHNELDPGRKTDPFKNALQLMGITKAQFIKDIIAEYKDCTEEEYEMKVADADKIINILKSFYAIVPDKEIGRLADELRLASGRKIEN